MNSIFGSEFRPYWDRAWPNAGGLSFLKDRVSTVGNLKELAVTGPTLTQICQKQLIA